MTQVLTTTTTSRDEPAAPAELVARQEAQGWVVLEVLPEATVMRHPGMAGVRLAVMSR
jgi:hypothetical protein